MLFGFSDKIFTCGNPDKHYYGRCDECRDKLGGGESSLSNLKCFGLRHGHEANQNKVGNNGAHKQSFEYRAEYKSAGKAEGLFNVLVENVNTYAKNDVAYCDGGYHKVRYHCHGCGGHGCSD